MELFCGLTPGGQYGSPRKTLCISGEEGFVQGIFLFGFPRD